MGGPTDFEMCMSMDSHLKGENGQKAMAGYVQHSAGAGGVRWPIPARIESSSYSSNKRTHTKLTISLNTKPER